MEAAMMSVAHNRNNWFTDALKKTMLGLLQPIACAVGVLVKLILQSWIKYNKLIN